MGGKEGGGPVTIGYHYFLSMHMVICQGPVDKIRLISSSDDVIIHNKDITRSGDEGVVTHISKPNLYGGPKKEGGVQGTLLTLFGGETQKPSPVLKDLLGGVLIHKDTSGVVGSEPTMLDVWKEKINKATNFNTVKITPDSVFQEKYLSAFRGVTSVIWDNMLYQTNSSRPKGWKFKVERIPYPELAHALITQVIPAVNDPYGVNSDITFSKTADGHYNLFGLRITPTTITATHLYAFKLEKRQYIYSGPEYPTWDGRRPEGEPPGWYRSGLSTTPEGSTGGSDWSIILDTGLESIAETNLFNLLLNAPTQSAGTLFPPKANALLPEDEIKSANPAYIILECLTNPTWGLGFDVEGPYIDKQSFVEAAAVLETEGFGLSAVWKNESSVEDFITTILGTINAVVYIAPVSGKFVIKLLRAEDATELVVNENNILEVRGFARSGVSELVNQLTVQWTDAILGGPKSLTVHNSAARELQGHTVSTSKTYSAVTDDKLAASLANRDLALLSQSLAGVEIVMNREAANLRIGSVIDWSWADYGIVGMSLRVSSISFGLMGDGRITAKCNENIFKTGKTKYTDLSPIDIPKLDVSCVYPPVRRVLSLNYLDMFRLKHNSTITSQDILNPDPTSGVVAVLAQAPNANSNEFKAIFANTENGFTTFTDAPASFTDMGALQFTPFARLIASISRTQTVLGLSEGTMLNLVAPSTIEIPSYVACCQGDKVEIMEVVSLVDYTVLTVKRGVNTAPKSFTGFNATLDPTLETELWFYSGDLDQRVIMKEFAEESTVYFKTLTEVNRKIYPMNASAITASTKVKSWAAPYPVANLQASVTGTDLAITWDHRDAILQQDKIMGQTGGSIARTQGIYYTYRLVTSAGLLVHDNPRYVNTSVASVHLTGAALATPALFIAVKAVLEDMSSEWNWMAIDPLSGTVVNSDTPPDFGVFEPIVIGIIDDLVLTVTPDGTLDTVHHRYDIKADSGLLNFSTNIVEVMASEKYFFTQFAWDNWFQHYQIEVISMHSVDLTGETPQPLILATHTTKQAQFTYAGAQNTLDHQHEVDLVNKVAQKEVMLRISAVDSDGVASATVAVTLNFLGVTASSEVYRGVRGNFGNELPVGVLEGDPTLRFVKLGLPDYTYPNYPVFKYNKAGLGSWVIEQVYDFSDLQLVRYSKTTVADDTTDNTFWILNTDLAGFTQV